MAERESWQSLCWILPPPCPSLTLPPTFQHALLRRDVLEQLVVLGVVLASSLKAKQNSYAVTLLIRRPKNRSPARKPPFARTRERRWGVPPGWGQKSRRIRGRLDDPAPGEGCAILPDEHFPWYLGRLLSLSEEPLFCQAHLQTVYFAQRFLSSSSSLIRDTVTTLALRPSRRTIQLFIFIPGAASKPAGSRAGSPRRSALKCSCGEGEALKHFNAFRQSTQLAL